MKAYKLSKYGLHNIKLVALNEPIVKANEVLVKQYATSINSADVDIIIGSLFGRISGPLVPKHQISGSDLAGVIEKLGADVKGFKVGDRVYGDMSLEGFATFATHKIVKANSLTKMPQSMSFVDAACLPSAGVLALQAIEKRELNKQSHVCINGVGGGMGTIALQIAKHYGAYIVGVDSTYKEDQIIRLGVDEYIDFQRYDYTKLNSKYDLIIDCQCYHPIKKFVSMLKNDGVYTMIGGSFLRIIQTAILGKRLTRGTDKSIGILMGEMNNLKRMERLSELYSDGVLKPSIDTLYDFNELPKALEHFLSGEFTGKIVIQMESESKD